ncbi:MAG: dihydrofolate reductase family protein [Solirubrobacterales bacterium]
MSRLRCHISISLDGYVAGPNQSEENPLGEGGEGLHEWVTSLAAWRETHELEGGAENENTRIVEEARENIGAAVMGRNMFGPPAGGPWDDEWKGWWGDDPPYHYDVYVITHHPRDPLVMEGGTTFHFVTEGIESALEQAKASAGGKDVMAWGGGQTISEYLAAGLVDELELHVVPIVLGGGASLWSELEGPTQFELVRVVEAAGVTHLKYWTTD